MLPLLLDPQTLSTIIQEGKIAPEQYLLIDLGTSTRYAEQHIPGAISVSPQEIMLGTPPAPGLMPSIDQLTQLFQRIGLTAEKQVMVYDDEGGGWAGRFIWLLDSIGHTSYSYLDGGLQAWIQDELNCTNMPTEPSPSAIQISINTKFTATAEQIMQGLAQSENCIWDARSPAEYDGSKVLAKRGGHIPGAINFEWTQAMDPARGLRIRNRENLLSTLEKLGINGEKPIITHCQTHHRSGFTYLVAKILGFKSVKAYDGSWSEWGNNEDTPVE